MTAKELIEKVNKSLYSEVPLISKFIEGGAPNKTKSKLIKAFIADFLSKAKTEERAALINEMRGWVKSEKNITAIGLLNVIRNKEDAK